MLPLIGYVAAATDALDATATPPTVMSDSEMGWVELKLPHHCPPNPVPLPPENDTVSPGSALVGEMVNRGNCGPASDEYWMNTFP